MADVSTKLFLEEFEVMVDIGIHDFENSYDSLQEENSNPIVLGNDLDISFATSFA